MVIIFSSELLFWQKIKIKQQNVVDKFIMKDGQQLQDLNYRDQNGMKSSIYSGITSGSHSFQNRIINKIKLKFKKNRYRNDLLMFYLVLKFYISHFDWNWIQIRNVTQSGINFSLKSLWYSIV